MNGRRPLPGPVASLLAAIETRRMTAIGTPYATDAGHTDLLAAVLRHGLRTEQNIGTDPTAGWFADQVIGQVATLMQAPPRAWDGAVCDSLTAATIRTLLPLRRAAATGLVLYRSAAGHPHVAEAAHLLGIDTVTVPADRRGVCNAAAFASQIRQHRSAAAVVVATLGTPATGASDDVAAVRAAVDGLPIRVHVHLDAPLEGLAQAAKAGPQAPIGLAAGADSVVVAGDQFLPVPLPCAVAVRRTEGVGPATLAPPSQVVGEVPDMEPDGALAGPMVRYGPGSGQAAVLLWQVLHELGVDGLARRARRSDALAGYTVRRLRELGWPVWRHPGSMTVLLQPPSELLLRRWSLPVTAGWAQIVCVPGVTEAHIDRFTAELRHEPPPVPAAAGVAPPAPGPGPGQGHDPSTRVGAGASASSGLPTSSAAAHRPPRAA